MKLILNILLISSLGTAPVYAFAYGHEGRGCSDLVRNQPAEIAQQASESVYKDLKQKGLSTREARGYAILIAAMVGSAAGATYLTHSLPQDFQFLSLFLAQVSTLGVYVFGAPIWEPLSSGFRKMAFGVRRTEGRVNAVALDPGFEGLWRRTQENYSLNEQMSRNVINQFVLSVQNNFYEAYRAVHSDNSAYAADQIAEAAYRLRTLFKDISPDDPSVASVVRSAFANHVSLGDEFRVLVFKHIEALDPSSTQDEVGNYYRRILETWLGPGS